MSFPVVQSKNTTLLLIAEVGHTTSQPQLPHVASIVTPPNQSSVSVMLVPCIRSNIVCEPLLVQLVLRSIEPQPPHQLIGDPSGWHITSPYFVGSLTDCTTDATRLLPSQSTIAFLAVSLDICSISVKNYDTIFRWIRK